MPFGVRALNMLFRIPEQTHFENQFPLDRLEFKISNNIWGGKMWRSLLSNAEGGIDLKYVIQDFKPDMFQQILASPPQKKMFRLPIFVSLSPVLSGFRVFQHVSS